MPITFKGFLAEAAVDKEPKYSALSVEQAINTLNAFAKDALWMLHNNTPLYRGDDHISALDKSGFATVDTSATERRSQNTTNYYTVILDNHPQRQNFPKRSRSFICTTEKSYAMDFGSDNPNIIVPFDSVKIGLVNDGDMWSTKISMFDLSSYSIDDFNQVFRRLGIIPGMNAFNAFAKKLKNGDSKALREFADTFLARDKKYDVKKEATKFMDELWRAYSAESTGHTWCTTATFPRKKIKTEAWVGGKVMVIKPQMWNQMRNALK